MVGDILFINFEDEIRSGYGGIAEMKIFDSDALIDKILVLHQSPKTLSIACKSASFSAGGHRQHIIKRIPFHHLL